jgi:hypothetical protein
MPVLGEESGVGVCSRSERTRQAAVQAMPVTGEKTGVEHLPDQRVRESVAVTARYQQS